MSEQGPVLSLNPRQSLNPGSCVLGQVGQRQKPFQGLTLEIGQISRLPKSPSVQIVAFPFETFEHSTIHIFFWDPEVGVYFNAI
jgi:hypothetical protein